jgi:putative ABC transport system permease protein
MNTKIFKIAINNVFKHKRRTFFNVATFMMNAVALIFVIGMIKGMYNQVFERTIELDTGHFKIYNKKYAKDKEKMPVEYNIEKPYEVIEAIKTIPYYVAAAPRIKKFAVISDFHKKSSVMMIGVDMVNELAAMKTLERVPVDSRLPETGGKILVGKRLAALMSAEPGGAMLLYSQTMHKANNLADVVVQGHYAAGFDRMEKGVVFVPFKFAAEFLDMGNAATEITVRIKDKMYIVPAKKAIEKILSEKFPGLTVRDWTQEAAGLIEGAKAAVPCCFYNNKHPYNYGL